MPVARKVWQQVVCGGPDSSRNLLACKRSLLTMQMLPNKIAAAGRRPPLEHPAEILPSNTRFREHHAYAFRQAQVREAIGRIVFV
jgi:hypothetical protein